MCINKVIAFTDLLCFYKKYKPLTPYGNEHKDAMPFYTCTKELDTIHAVIDQLIELINSQEHTAIRIESHLSRIDRLNNLDKSTYDVVDIHLIKKFLIHSQAIDTQLPQNIKEAIGLNFELEALLQSLNPDKQGGESFYLSASFDDELKTVRNSIAQIDEELNTIKQRIFKHLYDQYQLQFSGREFILVDKKRNELLETNELSCEFYDSQLIKIKPFFGKEYLQKQVEKEQLLMTECELEKTIIDRLSTAINHKTEEISASIEAIRLLDISLAKARLSIKYQLTKPNYHSEKTVVKEGIFYPLFEKHQDNKLSYTPLNASFDSNTVLLSGSNMGGKTVLFKTLAYLQLLTQLGFRIPAKEFHTKVYSAIHVLGANQNTDIEGLSSFGQEIHQLTKAFNSNNSKLLFIDELAKTTNATEAKAILYAALKYTNDNQHISGFFSTHFMNLPDIEGIERFRMKGLNKQAFEAHCEQQSDNIEERIRLINGFMQYEIVPDIDHERSKDALTIAGILGLNTTILNYANDYLDKR